MRYDPSEEGPLRSENTKKRGTVAERTIVYKLGVVAGIVVLGFGIADRYSISRMKSSGVSAIVRPIEGYTVRKSRAAPPTAQIHLQAGGRARGPRTTNFGRAAARLQGGTPVKIFYDPGIPAIRVRGQPGGS